LTNKIPKPTIHNIPARKLTRIENIISKPYSEIRDTFFSLNA
jgi:hypothetical protein